MLIGHFRTGEVPIWSLAYVRFWIVRQLVQVNPIVLFRGTVLYNLFLNALGARVALSAFLAPERVPVAADLLTIGADSVLQQHSLCAMYRAEAGRIHFAPVHIGRDVNVGINAVIDVGVTIEDGATLAHGGGVLEGQALRAGTSYGGAPAVPDETSPALGEVRHCGLAARFAYAGGAMATQLLVFALPLVLVGMAARHYASLREIAIGPDSADVPLHWIEPAGWAVVAYGVGILLALLVAGIVPRLAMTFVVPGRTYPLYGVAWSMLSLARVTGNLPYLHAIFGDSSYMVHFLRWIGYRLGRVEQTGSNFGIALRHDAPTLCHIGTGTMVSDGLFISNVRQSGSAFRAEPTRIGERSSFGNNLVFPSDARAGANVLYATKVGVPTTGELLSDTGLLGAPAIRIPRTSGRDAAAVAALTDAERQAGLRRKNRVNAGSIAALLISHALCAAGVAMLLAVAHGFYVDGSIAWVAMLAALPVAIAAYFVLVERASLAFRRIVPTTCSLYDTPFLAVERHWKLNTSPLAQAARGTPFRPLFLRAAGVRIGRRVFDDGCVMTEKTLVSVGDFATLGDHATLQGHSLEEGVFKCDALAIGDAVTIGQRALVHYGARLGEGCHVAPGAFVMKGEIGGPGTHWRGNPARPA